jgi:hypothetical protein
VAFSAVTTICSGNAARVLLSRKTADKQQTTIAPDRMTPVAASLFRAQTNAARRIIHSWSHVRRLAAVSLGQKIYDKFQKYF